MDQPTEFGAFDEFTTSCKALVTERGGPSWTLINNRIEETHKLTTAHAIGDWQAFVDQFEKYRSNMKSKLEEFIGEWKYTLVEIGLKAEFDEYIEQELERIVVQMNEVATEQLVYAIARIKGLITDEEHLMSPDELRAHRAKKNSGDADFKEAIAATVEAFRTISGRADRL
jgi:hypothetical protein